MNILVTEVGGFIGLKFAKRLRKEAPALSDGEEPKSNPVGK
jgi:nucleoside-diphosphate-sugar epimerase